MKTKKAHFQKTFQNPLEILEDIALSCEWEFQRSQTHGVYVHAKNLESPLSLFNHWDEQSGYFEFLGFFEVHIPPAKNAEVTELLSAINLDMRFGYFGICHVHQKPFFRHGLLACADSPIVFYQISEILSEVLRGGEKVCQALKLLLVEKKTLKESMFAASWDVVGEA